MTRKEFLRSIQKSIEVSEASFLDIQIKYRTILPEQIKTILSYAEQTVFFDDGWRLLSVQEILHADKELHIDFLRLRALPVFDTGDNDFIIYDINSNEWAKLNIIDECIFKRKDSLSELL